MEGDPRLPVLYMDAYERRLWHMIDVGDFGGAASVLGCSLLFIEEGMKKDSYSFAKDISEMRSMHSLLEERFSEIDLDSLDHRFPVEELRVFKHITLPEMKAGICLLSILLENPGHPQEVTDAALDRCRRSFSRMTIPMEAFHTSSRYAFYRKTGPERRYLFAEKRAAYADP